MQKDKSNMDFITSYLSNYPVIDGVVFLMKSNTNRLNVWFRPCIKVLFSKFPTLSTKCIMFMFTHARSTLFRPGESLQTLKLLIDRIREDNIADMAITNENLFMVDNEAHRYLLAREQVRFFEDEENHFANSWDRSAENCQRLIRKLAGVPWDSRHQSPPRYKIRRVLEELHRAMVDVAISTVTDARLIQHHMSALASKQVDVGELKNSLHITSLKTVRRKLPYPILVCTHENCIESIQCEDGRSITDYVTRCQVPCYIKEQPSHLSTTPSLRNCPSMRLGTCRKCSHDHTHHLPIDWEIGYQHCEMVDNRVQQQIVAAEETNATIQMQIQSQRDTLEQLEFEQLDIVKIFASFAAFLQVCSPQPSTDVFRNLLDSRLKTERESTAIEYRQLKTDESRVAILDKWIENYDDQKNIILEGMSSQPAWKTKSENVVIQMGKLYKLKHSGSQFKALAYNPMFDVV
ncbi:uncharacterized protein BJ171DRAFT_100149 [Polychytrium aggregatum]|uniref:uncharacterized protein n=1 Tax=Polychytrium aggregatum TaxID=110093 RepID=UPI0022FDB17A|nr:uncharacterized protein BJ171DRAFT_100149 [Polychytrium aggregatum]KAI9204710.1 hypothetical protein BJ171DRAFT_100149 [Polychytrium aggregatum]